MPPGLFSLLYIVSVLCIFSIPSNNFALLQRNQREIEFPSKIEDTSLSESDVNDEAARRSLLAEPEPGHQEQSRNRDFVVKGIPISRSRVTHRRNVEEGLFKDSLQRKVRSSIQANPSIKTIVGEQNSSPDSSKGFIQTTATLEERDGVPGEQGEQISESESGSGSHGSGDSTVNSDDASGDTVHTDNEDYYVPDSNAPSETYVEPQGVEDVPLASDPSMDPGLANQEDSESASGSGLFVSPDPGRIIYTLDQDLLEKGRESFAKSLPFEVNKRDFIRLPESNTGHRRQEIQPHSTNLKLDLDNNLDKNVKGKTKRGQVISKNEHAKGDILTKRTEIVEAPDSVQEKRQFISRPHYPFIIRNGYVYLKPPPMTQKTIVTTHIPRPPMVMAYNSFLNKYLRGSFRHQPQMIFENEDDNQEYQADDSGHCESDPCMNGGTCNEVRDGYECICPTGYKGTDCEEEDKCHPNPCHNSGVCTEANGQYVCTCPQGYKGLNCQEINKCQPTPCHNGGTCNEVNNDYECVCPSEYIGKDCSQINHCHMTPCLNGGTCTSQLGISLAGLVSCLCPPGFSGPRCEMRDKCHINPCKNGGNCREGNCICINGFSGDYCETPPSPCSITPCLNGGSCLVKGLSTYKCICRHGFKGQNCEEESHCDPNPCLNGASCMDTDEAYKCECSHGFKGSHCEDEVSPCDANPCLNDGTCVVEYSRFKCLCKPGYKGSNCEEIDRCHHRPCKNGGICSSDADDVRCQCLDGYRGLLCEEQDRCFPNPCLNGATCFENSDGFTCSCTSGFRGTHCSEHDPCHPNPCHHNGLCISEGEDYHCTCESGWLGNTCEDEDHCHPNPCLHGGVCVSRGGSMYECHCPSGYAGLNCEVSSPAIASTYQSSSTEHTISSVPAIVIPCRNTRYGCCPDGESAASGPSAFGCPAFIHAK